MNTPIVRLYGFILLLLSLLVLFTSNWAVFDASELEAKTENKRPLLEQQKIKRGEILSSDGELLAISKPRGKNESKRYVRSYPTGALFGNPVGYDFIDQRTGIELSENDVLVGEENEFATIIEQLTGSTQEGSDLTLTLDASAQRVATDMLNAQGPGALVALEPQTGAVRAMVSTPGFDPNEIPSRLEEFNNLPEGEPSVILNRATQGRYPPGSTMKVVTAAAALDSGEFTPDSTVDGSDGQEISGVPLQNSGDFSQNPITLTDALTNSVNTAWANVAEQLGAETMVEYMERFGFFSLPPLDYPEAQMTASGPRRGSRLVKDGFDVGRIAIGQGGEEGQMLVTPLQMATVVATVANAGKRMAPTFLQQVKDPDGRVTDELSPDEVEQVISEETAAQLTEMMTNVTEDAAGTASGLSLAGGSIRFAGKTGTAEIDLEGLNQAWFVMFAPIDDPQIAIAATVERCQGCFGADTAGPIATAVAEDLLGG